MRCCSNYDGEAIIADGYLLKFISTGVYVHPDRKWKMGISKDDHLWLTENFGPRAKNEATWNKGLGAWQYLGTQSLKENGYLVRIRFRSKSHAMLFKLSKIGVR